jgi:hypothetical protein
MGSMYKRVNWSLVVSVCLCLQKNKVCHCCRRGRRLFWVESVGVGE